MPAVILVVDKETKERVAQHEVENGEMLLFSAYDVYGGMELDFGTQRICGRFLIYVYNLRADQMEEFRRTGGAGFTYSEVPTQ